MPQTGFKPANSLF